MSRQRLWVLSLDVGTSSVTAGGYDSAGRPLPGVQASVRHVPVTTSDGGCELQALELVTRCLRVLRATLDAAAFDDPPSAVGFSCFWHSLIGLDGQGEAITPVFLWADTRSVQQVEYLRRQMDEKAYHVRTGCVFHSSYLPARLLWFRQQEPDQWSRIRYWVSFADYFYLRLFGRLITSLSMASGSGLFDQHELVWDAWVCEAIDLDRRLLPPLVDLHQSCSGLRGEYRSYLPELADIPWFPAVGDGACSNVGSGCATPQRLALMVGTSGALRCILRTSCLDIPAGLWCYRLDDRRFVLGGALSNGGNLITWLRDCLQLPPAEQLEQELASLAPDSHGLTLLPYWAGERSLGWAAHATGAIVGMRLHTKPVDVMRAAMEAVALRFAAIHERLRSVVPQTELLAATGGALLRSPVWMQIMADALGTGVQASAELEASRRGAALLALESLGALTDVADAPASFGSYYEPRKEFTKQYQAARLRQEKMYRMLVQGSRHL
ncbi:MAG: gluconokinase [Firmicutes bacterium]|nr:gluconokinase [Bacillota bacterium]